MAKNYSVIERKLASFFRKFPLIKKTIKSKYQYLNYLIYKTSKTIITDKTILKVSYDNTSETFFGYYDKTPLNETETKLLFQATSYSTKNTPSSSQEIKVLVKSFISDKILYEGNTAAYNWQQGCKLQWLDDSRFIFNIYNNSKKQFNSKIVNIETRKEELINYPIYDCTKNFGLTLNFETLNNVRPDYGYRQKDSRFSNLENIFDGIFIVDFLTKKTELLLSIEECLNISPKQSMINSKHWFNHIMISPKEDKFIFLHRWINNGRKYDRLLMYDLNTNKISVLLDNEMVSHCFWRDNDNIITFASTVEKGDAYYTIDSNTKIVNILEFIGSNTAGDGHPNVFNKTNLIIDTYPDRSRMKNLFIVDLESNKTKKIASLFESFKFKGQSRCDLHPRWSPKGNYIFFDSVHENEKRGLFYFKV